MYDDDEDENDGRTKQKKNNACMEDVMQSFALFLMRPISLSFVCVLKFIGLFQSIFGIIERSACHLLKHYDLVLILAVTRLTAVLSRLCQRQTKFHIHTTKRVVMFSVSFRIENTY